MFNGYRVSVLQDEVLEILHNNLNTLGLGVFLPFLKYNIYCLDDLIQNSFSFHFESGSTIQLKTKRNKQHQNQICGSVHVA